MKISTIILLVVYLVSCQTFSKDKELAKKDKELREWKASYEAKLAKTKCMFVMVETEEADLDNPQTTQNYFYKSEVYIIENFTWDKSDKKRDEYINEIRDFCKHRGRVVKTKAFVYDFFEEAVYSREHHVTSFY